MTVAPEVELHISHGAYGFYFFYCRYGYELKLSREWVEQRLTQGIATVPIPYWVEVDDDSFWDCSRSEEEMMGAIAERGIRIAYLKSALRRVVVEATSSPPGDALGVARQALKEDDDWSSSSSPTNPPILPAGEGLPRKGEFPTRARLTFEYDGADPCEIESERSEKFAHSLLRRNIDVNPTIVAFKEAAEELLRELVIRLHQPDYPAYSPDEVVSPCIGRYRIPPSGCEHGEMKAQLCRKVRNRFSSPPSLEELSSKLVEKGFSKEEAAKLAPAFLLPTEEVTP